MSDKESFADLVGKDVTPNRSEKRITLTKTNHTQANAQVRREAATAMPVNAVTDPLSSEPVAMVEPLALLEFKRPGVQNGVYRNLRLGKYAIDARLDMHRMTVEIARTSLYQFIQDCLENDVRTALITHGKGEGREQPALLKSCVAHWLPQIDEVLAFHTAMKHHGSYGATYVMLKKSERKKQQTREQNTLRRD